MEHVCTAITIILQIGKQVEKLSQGHTAIKGGVEM